MNQNPYTKGYFENAEGSHYKGYEDWPQFKERAEWIDREYSPRSVLELGAAKGYLLKHLKSMKIKVEGYDVSSYAASKSNGLVKNWDVTEQLMDFRQYGLVVSFDFLEHIKEEDLPVVLHSLSTAQRQFHMITTTEYDFGGDDTHFTSKPKKWWIDRFNKAGIKNYTIIHAGEQELMK